MLPVAVLLRSIQVPIRVKSEIGMKRVEDGSDLGHNSMIMLVNMFRDSVCCNSVVPRQNLSFLNKGAIGQKGMHQFMPSDKIATTAGISS